jgi:hypothetical protein
MKTFMQFIGIREETASYISEKKPDQKTKDADNTAIVVAALKHMLKTRPEVIIAFLNQHRMDPDIREILNNHNLDAFLDIHKKMNGGFTDKGLADRTGQEGNDQITPPAADGFSLN